MITDDEWLWLIERTGYEESIVAAGSITIENPDKLNATLRVSMTIAQWKEAREDLGKTNWATGGRILAELIDDLVSQVTESQFYARVDEKEHEKEHVEA